MTLHDDLVAAKALIATPEKWAKGVDLVRYLVYESTASGAAPAKLCLKMCARTAANSVDFRSGFALAALTDALPDGFGNVPTFNDHRGTTHADIMALFDRAINAALSPTEGERG